MAKPTIYTNKVLTGKACKIDDLFIPSIDMLCRYAASCNLKIYITDAFRAIDDKLKGSIVKPAKRSNHLVGHAIDCNLIDGKVHWNSEKLKGKLTGNVARFIDLVHNDGAIRWGGDPEFSPRDVVHFDDDLNHKDPKKWDELFYSLQAGIKKATPKTVEPKTDSLEPKTEVCSDGIKETKDKKMDDRSRNYINNRYKQAMESLK